MGYISEDIRKSLPFLGMVNCSRLCRKISFLAGMADVFSGKVSCLELSHSMVRSILTQRESKHETILTSIESRWGV